MYITGNPHHLRKGIFLLIHLSCVVGNVYTVKEDIVLNTI